MTEILCPKCALPWNLVAGKFPAHTSRGDKCRMSGHEPLEWPLPPEPAYAPTEVPPDPGVGGQTVGHAEAQTEPATPVEPVDKAADTKLTRKVRSNKGAKRSPRTKGGDPTVSEERQHQPSGPSVVPGGPAKPGQPNELASTMEEWRRRGEAKFLAVEPLAPPMPGVTTVAVEIARGGAPMPETPTRKPRSDRAQYMVISSVPIYASREAAEEAAVARAEKDSDKNPYRVYQVWLRSEARDGVQLTRIGRVRKAKQ